MRLLLMLLSGWILSGRFVSDLFRLMNFGLCGLVLLMR